MLRRKIYDQLLDWKARKHKCLMIKGQRQVGKTFIVEKFAHEQYEHVLTVNLSLETELRRIFEGNLDVDTILRNLMLYRDPNDFVPGSTLIFLDEIQECPPARTALKSFTIDGRYDVIASGSNLGIEISRHENNPLVPTGYEEHIEMRSLDFEEFLWAKNIPESAIDYVKQCVRTSQPIDDAVYFRFEALFREFMAVGGMPEVVESYLESGNYAKPTEVQKQILSDLELDINRYNRGVEKDKTLECFLSIPSQLSGTNKKFTYSRISGELSRKAADTYRENMLWIKGAGIGNFCYALKSVSLPLAMNEERNMFKVYLSDTGLLMNMCGQVAMRSVLSGDIKFNMGAIAENAVCECLTKSGYTPRYYRKNGGEMMMELDFVIELGDELAVIEVKSGKTRNAPSISKAPKYFRIGRRIMFEQSNIRIDSEGIEHYPLFAAAFIKDAEKIPLRLQT